MIKYKYIGQFETKSGKLTVTDPCYSPDVWCTAKVINCRKGTWDAYVYLREIDNWGQRVCEIVAAHKSDGIIDKWERVNVEIGVDSGQAGIFDTEEYNRIKRLKQYHISVHHFVDYCDRDDEGLYDSVCQITLGSEKAGCVKFGCVSSSGFGDGGYELFVAKENKKVIGVKIVFITETEIEARIK